MAYKGNDVQGTTKFTGKIYDKQIAEADKDQKDYMEVKKGTREIGAQIEKMDGDASSDRLAGGPAPLPRAGAK
jgi:hypothetical protein